MWKFRIHIEDLKKKFVYKIDFETLLSILREHFRENFNLMEVDLKRRRKKTHVKHVEKLFQKLGQKQLYVTKSKCANMFKAD